MKGGRTHFVVVIVANLCPTLCDLIVCSVPGLPLFHHSPTKWPLPHRVLPVKP